MEDSEGLGQDGSLLSAQCILCAGRILFLKREVSGDAAQLAESSVNEAPSLILSTT